MLDQKLQLRLHHEHSAPQVSYIYSVAKISLAGHCHASLWDGHLVEGDNERCLLLLQQVDGLYRLGLKTMHDVHDQDGYVTQAAASGAQIGERLVTCAS